MPPADECAATPIAMRLPSKTRSAAAATVSVVEAHHPDPCSPRPLHPFSPIPLPLVDVAASLMESSADHAEQHGGGPAAASRAERHAAGQRQVQIHATPARIILPDGTPGPVLDMEYSDSDLAKMAQQEFLEMEQVGGGMQFGNWRMASAP